ncbi:MAG: protein phosphatase 2C domain-containing protein [Phycisphaerales bacterium]|nr:protein phosphatase 2C domain-containing protein [Phycisphaerales bacterium]
MNPNTPHLVLSRTNTPETAGAPLSHGQVQYASVRSPGKATDNEDALAILPVDRQRSVLAVADGVGGRTGGADAAELTLEVLARSVAAVGEDESALRTAILNGIEAAQAAVLALGIGAATTLALVEIDGNLVRPYHIGDSEILVIGQRGKIHFQSISHSMVAYAVEAGMLCPDEAVHHKDRHIISNAIGLTDMRIEIGPAIRLQARDTVLLATDGLFDNLYPAEVIERVRRGPLDRAVAALAELALSRMMEPGANMPSKPDDLTLIAFRQQT